MLDKNLFTEEEIKQLSISLEHSKKVYLDNWQKKFCPDNFENILLRLKKLRKKLDLLRGETK